MRKSINILHYQQNLLGAYTWKKTTVLTWQEYLQYSKTVSGEGKQWKAEF
jgi:hypothetical protein